MSDLVYYTDGKRHLVCKPYSIANLHIMAEKLGINRCFFHSKKKQNLSHYDVPKMRVNEIEAKCVMVTEMEIVNIIKNKHE